MKSTSGQYELLLENATEITSACLDMENGALLFAYSSELIRDLAVAGYVRSAALAIQKFCEISNAEAQWIEYGERLYHRCNSSIRNMVSMEIALRPRVFFSSMAQSEQQSHPMG